MQKLVKNEVCVLVAAIIILASLNFLLSSFYPFLKHSELVKKTIVTGDASASISFCLNRPPLVNISCNIAANVGELYYCNIDVTDTINQTHTFYDNISIFNINNLTGEINFTPTSGDVGVHYINISVADDSGCSNNFGSDVLIIAVVTAPTVTPPSGGGGGGGGGVTKEIEKKVVVPEIKIISALPPLPIAPVTPELMADFDKEREKTKEIGLFAPQLFIYKKLKHVLTINYIKDNLAGVEIDGEQISFELMINKPRYIDIDDGAIDFELVAIRIDKNKVYLSMKSFYKEVKEIKELPKNMIIPIEAKPFWRCSTILFIILIVSAMIYVSLEHVIQGSNPRNQS